MPHVMLVLGLYLLWSGHAPWWIAALLMIPGVVCLALMAVCSAILALKLISADPRDPRR